MVFITVRHGANAETVFNQDCRCAALLWAIREKCCDYNSDEVIDLSDKDGNVKDLRKYPQMTAKEVLADREDCVLLKVGENEKGKLVYTPLLENDEIITKAFLEKLAKGSRREANKSQKSAARRGSSGSSSATGQQAASGAYRKHAAGTTGAPSPLGHQSVNKRR